MIKPYHKILSTTAILLLITACSKQVSYDELISDLPANVQTRTYSSSKMNYRISLSKELELIDKDYKDTLSIEVFLDSTIDFMEGTNIISVLRYQSNEKTLEGAWKKLASKREKMQDFKIHSEGKTSFLSSPAYYEHASYPVSKKDRESISFLIKGKSFDFYAVSLETSKENNYPYNMKRLLACVKTLKILP
jgi:hypothetical protein